MKYTFRGSTVDFGQPNQKGQGQTKDQWVDARLQGGAFADVTATDAEKKAALADAWDKLAEERGDKKAAPLLDKKDDKKA